MKKKLTASASLLLCSILLFSGCGKKSYATNEAYTGGSADYYAKSDSYYDNAYYEPAEGDYDYNDYGSYDDYDSVVTGNTTARAETWDKIIYSGSARVETIRFEETIEQVYALIENYNGFLESSYVTGKDYATTYYGRNAYRTASFTIRIPRDMFQSFTGSLETLGNLTSSSVEGQNITSAYRDTESRLATYRTEEERLLSMLEKAENVEDMLNIEDRLASVRYNIESLTTSLNNWDSMVNYSTLELSISEVKELTPETPITRTFGEEIAEGVKSSCRWLVQAFKDGTIFVLSAIPVLILPAIIVIVVVRVIRAKKSKKRQKQQANDVEVDR